jgi:hypothetical protein
MARRRRTRRYSGITSVNLGALPGLDILDRSASGMDVLMGAAVGFVGAQVVSGLASKYLPASIKDTLLKPDSAISKVAPLVMAGTAGAILYYAQRKSSRGYGHLIGALAVGAALTVREFLKGKEIAGIKFDEVVGVNLGGYSGLLVSDTTGLNGYNGYDGLLVSDTTGARASLNELGALSMGHDDDGLYSLMSA